MFFRFPPQRKQYWSCTKFAAWLRMILGCEAKPGAATTEDWHDWRVRSVSKNKVAHWIIEEGLDSVQNILHFPTDVLDSIRYYIKNRFIDKLHYLPTGLKPGEYADTRERILHGVFESVVDFVEIENAHMQLCWSGKEEKRPLRYKIPLLRWKAYRSSELGLKYLAWETTLDSEDLDSQERVPSQAAVAREIIALYNWWKNVRPNRPDPMDASGWTAYCDEQRKEDNDLLFSQPKTDEEKERVNKMLDTMHAIETQQDQEDEDMLIRVMKIRLFLWT